MCQGLCAQIAGDADRDHSLGTVFDEQDVYVEIADYLKVARRRLWILILVPLLAAGAALAYGLLSPRTYSSTATVLTPSLVGAQYSQFTGPQAIDQFVSAFAASAADPTVVAQTAKETGISAEALTDNVTVEQVGASSNVTLTFSGRARRRRLRSRTRWRRTRSSTSTPPSGRSPACRRRRPVGASRPRTRRSTTT